MRVCSFRSALTTTQFELRATQSADEISKYYSPDKLRVLLSEQNMQMRRLTWSYTVRIWYFTH